MGTKEKILGVFAHCDDEIVCGWPVMQREDAELHLLTVCDKGERGEALKKVCERAGIRHVEHECDFKPRFSLDRSGAETVTIARLVAEAVKEIKPDAVVTHNQWGEYGHPDHVLLSQIVRNYTTGTPVLCTSLDIPSLVWLKRRVREVDIIEKITGIDKNTDFWHTAKAIYGRHWTTNHFINNGSGRTAVVYEAGPDEGPVKLIRNMAVWLCDQAGWAFYNQATALAREMSGYAHRVMYLEFDGQGRTYYLRPKDTADAERADVIIAMTPAALKYIPQRENVVTRISGRRSV